MKRSHIVMLFAGGTALAGVYAYSENQNCRPDAIGEAQSHCSSRGSSGSSAGSHMGWSSSSSSSSTVHGGFGMTGGFHGGGG